MSDTSSLQSGGRFPSIEIKDFSECNQDTSRLDYYRSYLDSYFSDEFRFGQGTEHILRMISEYHVQGDWLDLGAGPATLFWSIPMRLHRSIACCDLACEALQVLAEFAGSSQLPRCYRQVLAMFEKSSTHIEQMAHKIGTFYTFDALSPWPEEFSGKKYDLITAMGLFGLSSTPDKYVDCFKYLRPHLRFEGRVIGANWVRSPQFIKQEGHDSSYLTEKLVERAASGADLEIVQLGSTEIQGDPLFSRVLYWAMRPAKQGVA